MDLSARYGQLCGELGNLDLELEVRQRRRVQLLAEMETLQRLAAQIAAAQQRGGPNVAPAPVDAASHGPA